jgi:hypothetical protein
MYTYGGDANLDGKINIDDYGIIDVNVGIQGPPFATGGDAQSLSVTAVPEPWGLVCPLIASKLLLRRRRRGWSSSWKPNSRPDVID